nr:hypothetical protein [Lachnospiraceae bacterium]
MRKNIKLNKQIIKALSIGISASMMLQPMTAFADTPDAEPSASDNTLQMEDEAADKFVETAKEVNDSVVVADKALDAADDAIDAAKGYKVTVPTFVGPQDVIVPGVFGDPVEGNLFVADKEIADIDKKVVEEARNNIDTYAELSKDAQTEVKEFVDYVNELSQDLAAITNEIKNGPVVEIEVPAEENTEEGKTEEGKTEEGNSEEGKTEEGKTEEGKTEEGKTEEGNTEEGKTEEGNTEDNINEETAPLFESENKGAALREEAAQVASDEATHATSDADGAWSLANDTYSSDAAASNAKSSAQNLADHAQADADVAKAAAVAAADTLKGAEASLAKYEDTYEVDDNGNVIEDENGNKSVVEKGLLSKAADKLDEAYEALNAAQAEYDRIMNLYFQIDEKGDFVVDEDGNYITKDGKDVDQAVDAVTNALDLAKKAAEGAQFVYDKAVK